jgi:hypothetical protein
MGIFNRIGDVIRSYLNSEDDRIFDGSGHEWRRGPSDPDLEEAFEELDAFLSRKSREKRQTPFEDGAWSGNGGDWSGDRTRDRGSRRSSGAASGGDWSGSFRGGTGSPGSEAGGAPERLGKDFAELGLMPGASEEDCKAAYKQLLKKHHPDRHAGHPGNMKKATERTARINAAYDRILRWRQTGKTD